MTERPKKTLPLSFWSLRFLSSLPLRPSQLALAKRLLGCAHPVQGTLHFKYKGKVLDALRKAHEAS